MKDRKSIRNFHNAGLELECLEIYLHHQILLYFDKREKIKIIAIGARI